MAWQSNLGDYLRSRRELLTPEDVGLPPGERRRVPGLRREEVAVLAGISPEYYLRLEQGRDLNPSAQVLASIAAALNLDDDGSLYLAELAHRSSGPDRSGFSNDGVTPGLQALISSWAMTPAYVSGSNFTVLAANPLAIALNPLFGPGANIVKGAFVEPSMKEFYIDWEGMTARAVPYLRGLIGSDVDHDDVVELVQELSERSERFRTLWARHDVRRRSSGATLMQHPIVGRLELLFENFLVPSSGQVLSTYHAEPESESYAGLLRLAEMVAREDRETPEP